MQLPRVLPDEILFSRLCRHLTLSGFSKAEYLKEIFGNSRLSIHPYLNSHLPEIAKFSDESPRDLWRTQTLLPLFDHCLSKYRNQIQNLTLSSGELVRACQIASFREHAVLSLKFCPICIRGDIEIYGVPYWHRSHQIPGIEVCSKHRIWLKQNELPQRTHIVFGLMPPNKCCAKQSSIFAWRLAKYSENILNELSGGVSKEHNYLNELCSNGYVTENGRVRRKALASDLFEAIEMLDYPDKVLLPESRNDFKYWSPLLVEGAVQHPFKHLLLGFLLQHFCEAKGIPEEKNTCPSRGNELIERQCCDLLMQRVSMAEVSRRTGKSRCYIKSLALRKKIPVSLKPRVITEDVKQGVIRMARKGFHRVAIARRFDISSGSVELIVSTTLGLVEWRKCCKAESLCRRYKVQIIRFLQGNPNALRQQVKQYCNAAFFWLYHHQPKWLESFLPKPKKAKHVDRIDWQKRDKELSELVSKVMECPEKPLSRTELDRRLGDHGWLTSKKHKLPLTISIVKRIGC